MPNKLTLAAMNVAHRGLIAASFGRLGWSVAKMPVLELTTTGRRSGQARSTMLTSPLQLGDALVVVASRGGDDHPPAWLLNIEANPEVRVVLDGNPPVRMHARVMTKAERDEHWPTITASYPNYAGYQRKTNRVIPLVVLEPIEGASRT